MSKNLILSELDAAKWSDMLHECLPGTFIVQVLPEPHYRDQTILCEDAGFELRDVIVILRSSGNYYGMIAMKPLLDSFAQNVLDYGVGGLNIKDSRIESPLPGEHHKPFMIVNTERTVYGQQRSYQPTNASGRFPANLILMHDENCTDECTSTCSVKSLDDQSGFLFSAAMTHEVGGYEQGTSVTPFLKGQSGPSNQYADSGGASRFFFKAHHFDEVYEYLNTLVTTP